mgnify:CR=1 FL=1
MQTTNVVLNADQLGEIFYALQERQNALIQSLANRDRAGAILRIEERQLQRVRDALHAIEYGIQQTAQI